MTALTYFILALGALLASTVSGVTGVGGGMVYLPILTWGVGLKAAVPYLTTLLVVGNFSRAWLSRHHIDWAVYRNFMIGAVPGTILGALFYTVLSAFWIAKILGVYLLVYVGLSFTKTTWPKQATLISMRWIGFPAGIISSVVGGTGPVVVPWFLRYGLVKEAFLGTEAICAASIHVIKLLIWGGIGVFGRSDVLLLAPLTVLMVAGSYLGKFLVTRMRVHVFRAMLLVVLTAIGIRFLLF